MLTGAGFSSAYPAAKRREYLDDYLEDPRFRMRSWLELLHAPVWTESPSEAHRALVDLERSGRLLALLTETVDGLHQIAGSSSVIELRGSIRWTTCIACRHRAPMREQLDRVEAGDPDPRCEVCGGIQKPATVALGEDWGAEALHDAMVAVRDCDVFVAVGTRMTTEPAAALLLELELKRKPMRFVSTSELARIVGSTSRGASDDEAR